jgi:peptidoglycan/LPS O-acetylase OafA/YrhL
MAHMYLMVDFFFILSGFILCHVYGKYFAESVSRKEFKKFSIARFARVYPLHFATLCYLILFILLPQK